MADLVHAGFGQEGDGVMAAEKFKVEVLCSFIDKYSKNKLQFIHYKIFKDAHDIFNSFDFEHVMGAFDFATEEFILHENFMKTNAQRLMQFNPATDFPITSMMRVQKYKERGYTISKAQILRIAFTIANKEYTSWEDVKSEVSGLYGIAPEDIHHIFKRFYRSKHSLDTPGIGLGLPLAKSIIEGQGGLISVQSDLHRGTTFTISFLTKS